MNRSRSLFASSLVAASVALALAHNAVGADTRPQRFDIGSQSLATALTEFARQSDRQILFSTEVAASKQTQGVKGTIDAEAALRELLKGTDLTYRETSDGAILVESAARDEIARVKNSAVKRVALLDENAEGGRAAEDSSSTNPAYPTPQREADQGSMIKLEEVVVTGSHIRGVQDLSSPVITFDRKDIEASGYATTQQFIQSLPQNLSNVSDTTFGAVNGGPNEATYSGAGLNLRGLGSDSTLVLLNGRRLAAAGKGSFVDVSLIPLSAIERIDVLADGASAIYGSDAVGGVVNFVLRKDFEGAETRVRYGTVTQGNHDELQAGQMFGHAWGSGRALVSYEYYRRTPLDGADRDFIKLNESTPEYEAIPGQKRHSALAVLSQQISDRLELSSELFFSQRESAFSYMAGSLITMLVDDEVKQYGGSLGLSVDVARDWQVRFSSLIDQSDSARDYFENGSPGLKLANESRLWSLDVAADGSLGSAPGGDVRLALGAQVRSEQFKEGRASIAAHLERDIMAAYAEVRVPWVGAQNRRAGLEHLELTLAGRFEDYSDFGSTFNPKIGLAWAPVTGLNLRGTWGTSFKAPVFSRMNPADRVAIIYEDFFVDPPGHTTGLLLDGSGSELGPEESTNWTVGLDFTPEALPGLNFSTTYFDVAYDERIRKPLGGDPFGVLLDPAYAAVITRHPDPADLAALLSGFPRVICFSAQGVVNPCTSPPLDAVTAVIDDRVRNLAAVRQSGLDFSARYRLASPIGEWGLTLSGQHLLKNREQLVSSAPSKDQLNDVWRPVDLRLRSSVSFTRGALNTTASINYTDSYRDRRDPGQVRSFQRSSVSSWTTVDLTVQYDLGAQLARLGLEGTLALNAVNLFDRNPPFVGSADGIHFDGVNANPLGRFVGAQFTARW